MRSVAWFGHFAIEHNKPAAFGHPLWSVYADLLMFSKWASGTLAHELRRPGIEPDTNVFEQKLLPTHAAPNSH
jgi:hypothetical protein